MPNPWEMDWSKSGTESQPSGQMPWEQDWSGKNDTPKTGAARSFSDNMANSAAFGYVPQMVGGITKLLSPTKDEIASVVRPDIAAKPDKKDIPYDPYMIGRDSSAKDFAKEQSDHPTASLGGSVAGAIGSAILMPTPQALEAKGILGGITKGALIGGTYGAVANPGDIEGEYNPTQLDARLENAKQGAEVGAVTGGVTQGLLKGINAVKNAPETLSEAANSQAVKASGAMLKDFRALNGADRTQAVGQFALDNGLVKAGDTFETVGKKAESLKQDAGSRLSTLYTHAGEAMPEAGKLPDDIGFNPIRDKSKILEMVSDHLEDQEGKAGAVQRISNYLDELGDKYGDKVLDPKTANNIEGVVSNKINFLRNPLTASPEAEQAFTAMRKFVSDAVDNHIDYMSKFTKDPQAGAKLAEANRDYGYAKTIENMAKDKAARILANNKMSLTDTIAGGAGAGAGAMVGAASGDSKEGAIGALAGGIGMGMLHHYGKVYGDATLASGLNAASKAARMGPSQVAGAASNVMNPAVANILARASGQAATSQGVNPQPTLPTQSPDQLKLGPSQNSVPQPTPKGVQPMGVPQAPQPQQVAPADSKGPNKWANDGWQNLKGHVNDEDREMLEKYKGAMLVDPKAKQLLITASSYQPGSKPLDQIMKHLKNRLESDSK